MLDLKSCPPNQSQPAMPTRPTSTFLRAASSQSKLRSNPGVDVYAQNLGGLDLTDPWGFSFNSASPYDVVMPPPPPIPAYARKASHDRLSIRTTGSSANLDHPQPPRSASPSGRSASSKTSKSNSQAPSSPRLPNNIATGQASAGSQPVVIIDKRQRPRSSAVASASQEGQSTKAIRSAAAGPNEGLSLPAGPNGPRRRLYSTGSTGQDVAAAKAVVSGAGRSKLRDVVRVS